MTASRDWRRLIRPALGTACWAATLVSVRTLLADPGWLPGMPVDHLREGVIVFFQMACAGEMLMWLWRLLERI